MNNGFEERLETFWAFYDEELAPWLARQEAQRRRTLKTAIILAGGSIAVALLSIALFWIGFGSHPLVAILFAGGIPLFIGFGGAWLVTMMFKGRIKLFLIPKVVSYFGYDYSHRPRDFCLSAYIDNALVPGHDAARLEDSIDGTENGVSFRLCEAVFQKRRGKTSSGSTTYKTIERTLLLSFEVSKPFDGRTVVLRDPAALKRVFGSAPAERVKLENPSFEKVFDVYGTDQIEARYLMTPAFMERVSRLAESTGGATPQLAFDGSHLLIALPLDKDRFEAQSLFTPMDDRSRTEALVEELQIVSSIIETLKLNLKTHA